MDSVKETELFKLNRRLITLLKLELEEALHILMKFKVHLKFEIPPIHESSKPFEIQIQSELVNALKGASSSATIVLSYLGDYEEARILILKKYFKYPSIEDFGKSILEIDEVQYGSLFRWFSELQSIYVVLHDLIHKNSNLFSITDDDTKA